MGRFNIPGTWTPDVTVSDIVGSIDKLGSAYQTGLQQRQAYDMNKANIDFTTTRTDLLNRQIQNEYSPQALADAAALRKANLDKIKADIDLAMQKAAAYPEQNRLDNLLNKAKISNEQMQSIIKWQEAINKYQNDKLTTGTGAIKDIASALSSIRKTGKGGKGDKDEGVFDTRTGITTYPEKEGQEGEGGAPSATEQELVSMLESLTSSMLGSDMLKQQMQIGSALQNQNKEYENLQKQNNDQARKQELVDIGKQATIDVTPEGSFNIDPFTNSMLELNTMRKKATSQEQKQDIEAQMYSLFQDVGGVDKYVSELDNTIEDPNKRQSIKNDVFKIAAEIIPDSNIDELPKQMQVIKRAGLGTDSVANPNKTYDNIMKVWQGDFAGIEDVDFKNRMRLDPYMSAARKASRNGNQLFSYEIDSAQPQSGANDIIPQGGGGRVIKFTGQDGTTSTAPLPQTEADNNVLNLIDDTMPSYSRTLGSTQANKQKIQDIQTTELDKALPPMPTAQRVPQQQEGQLTQPKQPVFNSVDDAISQMKKVPFDSSVNLYPKDNKVETRINGFRDFPDMVHVKTRTPEGLIEFNLNPNDDYLLRFSENDSKKMLENSNLYETGIKDIYDEREQNQKVIDSQDRSLTKLKLLLNQEGVEKMMGTPGGFDRWKNWVTDAFKAGNGNAQLVRDIQNSTTADAVFDAISKAGSFQVANTQDEMKLMASAMYEAGMGVEMTNFTLGMKEAEKTRLQEINKVIDKVANYGNTLLPGRAREIVRKYQDSIVSKPKIMNEKKFKSITDKKGNIKYIANNRGDLPVFVDNPDYMTADQFLGLEASLPQKKNQNILDETQAGLEAGAGTLPIPSSEGGAPPTTSTTQTPPLPPNTETEFNSLKNTQMSKAQSDEERGFISSVWDLGKNALSNFLNPLSQLEEEDREFYLNKQGLSPENVESIKKVLGQVTYQYPTDVSDIQKATLLLDNVAANIPSFVIKQGLNLADMAERATMGVFNEDDTDEEIVTTAGNALKILEMTEETLAEEHPGLSILSRMAGFFTLQKALEKAGSWAFAKYAPEAVATTSRLASTASKYIPAIIAESEYLPKAISVAKTTFDAAKSSLAGRAITKLGKFGLGVGEDVGVMGVSEVLQKGELPTTEELGDVASVSGLVRGGVGLAGALSNVIYKASPPILARFKEATASGVLADTFAKLGVTQEKMMPLMTKYEQMVANKASQGEIHAFLAENPNVGAILETLAATPAGTTMGTTAQMIEEARAGTRQVIEEAGIPMMPSTGQVSDEIATGLKRTASEAIELTGKELSTAQTQRIDKIASDLSTAMVTKVDDAVSQLENIATGGVKKVGKSAVEGMPAGKNIDESIGLIKGAEDSAQKAMKGEGSVFQRFKQEFKDFGNSQELRNKIDISLGKIDLPADEITKNIQKGESIVGTKGSIIKSNTDAALRNISDVSEQGFSYLAELEQQIKLAGEKNIIAPKQVDRLLKDLDSFVSDEAKKEAERLGIQNPNFFRDAFNQYKNLSETKKVAGVYREVLEDVSNAIKNPNDYPNVYNKIFTPEKRKLYEDILGAEKLANLENTVGSVDKTNKLLTKLDKVKEGTSLSSVVLGRENIAKLSDDFRKTYELLGPDSAAGQNLVKRLIKAENDTFAQKVFEGLKPAEQKMFREGILRHFNDVYSEASKFRPKVAFTDEQLLPQIFGVSRPEMDVIRKVMTPEQNKLIDGFINRAKTENTLRAMYESTKTIPNAAFVQSMERYTARRGIETAGGFNLDVVSLHLIEEVTKKNQQALAKAFYNKDPKKMLEAFQEAFSKLDTKETLEGLETVVKGGSKIWNRKNFGNLLMGWYLGQIKTAELIDIKRQNELYNDPAFRNAMMLDAWMQKQEKNQK